MAPGNRKRVTSNLTTWRVKLTLGDFVKMYDEKMYANVPMPFGLLFRVRNKVLKISWRNITFGNIFV